MAWVEGLSGLGGGGSHDSTLYYSTQGWAEQKPAVFGLLGPAQSLSDLLPEIYVDVGRISKEVLADVGGNVSEMAIF
jgi:hypothetical protein